MTDSKYARGLIRFQGNELVCIGRNKDGSPKPPLRTKTSGPLQAFYRVLWVGV